MRNPIFIKVIILLVFTFQACSGDDDNNLPDDVNNGNQVIRGSNWVITLLEDDGQNETYHFSGYNFTFENNGIAKAVKQSVTVNGTWLFRSSSSGQLKLVLNFGTSDPWDELEDDWDVLSITASEIKLRSISGGNGGTDYLTFTKP